MSRLHQRSRNQEERGARRFGGRRTPGSGNGTMFKNDVRAPDVSIEYKYTDNKTYRLDVDEFEKGERQALADGAREFALITEIRERELVTISREYYEVLRGNS